MSIRNRSQHVHSILLVMPSPIGDFLMATPVLEALHARFPAATFDIAGDPRTTLLTQHCPYVDRRIGRPKRTGLRTRLAALRTLRERRYDLIVDLRTACYSWLLRGRRRLIRASKQAKRQHEVVRHFQILQPLGMSFADAPQPRMWLGEADHAEADRLLSDLPGKRWLAMSPGGSWIGKRWPSRYFRDLAKRLSGECDAIVLLGNHCDEKNCKRIADALNTPHLDLGNKAGLMLTAALLQRMQLYIGNCSGLGHMAAAVGTPTFTLFGPTDPLRYHPWGPHARWIESPTSEMEALTLDAVTTGVQAALAERVNRHVAA